MIIEGMYQEDIKLSAFDEIDGLLWQGNKSLCIDKQQATQLIAALQKWVDGGEVDLMHFKTTESLRDEMVGWVFQDSRGNCATVVNVVRAGSGHQVHFNYGADYNVYCALGRFRKRYPYRIKTV